MDELKVTPTNRIEPIHVARDHCPHRPQSSSASRRTAGAFGFLTFIQWGERPER